MGEATEGSTKKTGGEPGTGDPTVAELVSDGRSMLDRLKRVDGDESQPKMRLRRRRSRANKGRRDSDHEKTTSSLGPADTRGKEEQGNQSAASAGTGGDARPEVVEKRAVMSGGVSSSDVNVARTTSSSSFSGSQTPSTTLTSPASSPTVPPQEAQLPVEENRERTPRLPLVGERLRYFSGDGQLVLVMRNDDGTFRMSDSGDETGTEIDSLNAQAMANVLRFGRFAFDGEEGKTAGVDTTSSPIISVPDAAVVPEASSKNDADTVIKQFFAPEESTVVRSWDASGREQLPVAKGDQKAVGEKQQPSPEEMLAQATEALTTARTRYAEAYYKEHTAINSIKRVLGRAFQIESLTADDERMEYDRALIHYQETRLALLKKTATFEEYKTEAATLLTFMALEGKIALRNDFQSVRERNMNLLEKGEAWLGHLGEWYQQQPLKKRLLIGAGLGVAGVALAGGASGAATIGALSVVVARRVLGAAGSYKAASGIVGALQERRQAKQQAAEQKADLAELEKDARPDKRIHYLEQLLEEKRTAIQAEFEKRNRSDLYRKTTAQLAAAIVGSGVLFEGIKWTIREVTTALQSAPWGVRLFGNPEGAVQQVSGTLQSAPPEQAAASSPALGVSAAGEAAPPTVEPAPSVVTEAAAEAVTHEVKRGDTIWGILKGRLSTEQAFNDLSAERKRIALDVLKDKLAALKPEALEDAGITSKNIDRIKVGETIDLGKLLSPDEWQQAIADAKQCVISATEPSVGGSPEGLPAPATAAAPVTPESAQTEWKINADRFRPVYEQATPALPVDDVTAWLKEHPGRLSELTAKGGNYLVAIFQTHDVAGDVNFDYGVHGGVFGRVEAARVIQDMTKLSRNPFFTYDRSVNPLHFSQMRELAEFMQTAQKTFGDEPGIARAGESIHEYVKRMAMLSAQTGKRIGVYN